MSGMDERDKEDVAAWSFVALLALVGGGVGLVIAALAVGTQRAWQGRAGGSPARSARRQEFLGDQRAWSAQDAQRRAAWREQRRQWWSDGADPATRPARESWWRRFGTWWHRRWARAVVAAEDFRDGWEAGWEAAEEARRDGAGWRTGGARPDPDATDEPASDEDAPDPLPTDQPQPAPETQQESPDGPADGDGSATPADGPEQTAEDSPAPKTAEPAPAEAEPDSDYRLWPDERAPATTPEPPAPAQPADTATPTAQPSQPSSSVDNPIAPTDDIAEPTNGGNTVTAPVQTTAPQAGETNTDRAASAIDGINIRLTAINDQIDALSQEAQALATQVREESDRVANTGSTAHTKQAMDAASAASERVTSTLGVLSDTVVAASDEATQARLGLQPALNAQDELFTAGADGRAVAAATD